MTKFQTISFDVTVDTSTNKFIYSKDKGNVESVTVPTIIEYNLKNSGGELQAPIFTGDNTLGFTISKNQKTLTLTDPCTFPKQTLVGTKVVYDFELVALIDGVTYTSSDPQIINIKTVGGER